MGEIEDRVLRALRRHHLAPEAVELAVEAYRIERQRLAQEHAKTRNQCERELSELKRRIAHLVSAIETGAEPGPLVVRLSELEAERRLVDGRMQRTPAAVVTLHPHAAARYRQKVAEIQDALSKGDAAGAEAVALVRELIGEIRVVPRGKGEPVILEIAGDLAALLAQEPTANAVTGSVVAGAGFEPTTFRL